MKTRTLIAAAAFAGVAGQAIAAEPVKPWKGEAELGVVSTGGNTETTNVKARAGVVYEVEKWRHTARIDALNTSDKVRTTAERYLASWKSDYKFDEFNYMFGLISYENDRFAGFDYRVSEAIGYGRRLINRPTLTLDTEIGPGARQTKLKTGESENELIGRLAGNLAWKISDTATFTENLSTEIGKNATITRSVTALTAQLVGTLAMKLSFTARHISDVPVDREKLDTETAVTLVYGF